MTDELAADASRVDMRRTRSALEAAVSGNSLMAVRQSTVIALQRSDSAVQTAKIIEILRPRARNEQSCLCEPFLGRQKQAEKLAESFAESLKAGARQSLAALFGGCVSDDGAPSSPKSSRTC